jgi:hypothetical protein
MLFLWEQRSRFHRYTVLHFNPQICPQNATPQVSQRLPIIVRLPTNLTATNRFALGLISGLAEHPRVEPKPLRFPEFDSTEMNVSGVQQDIPFAADRCRWHEQGDRLSSSNPFVAKPTLSFVSRFAPICRQTSSVESPDFELVRDLAFDRNQVFGL